MTKSSMPNAPKDQPMWDESPANEPEADTVGSWVTAVPVDALDPLESAVETVADRCFTEAENLGWHKSWDAVLKRAMRGEAEEGDVLNWVNSKMLLIVGEICEAQEELRNGRDLKAVYYRDVNGRLGEVNKEYDEQVWEVVEGCPEPLPTLKPEGWLVEMADALIRLNDLVGTVAGQEGVFFGPIVAEKLQYNATRGIMHGGKKF